MKRSQIFYAITLFLFLSINGFAQKPKSYNAAELKLKLKKLNVLGNALYVAAHPDDENTRLIAYLSNEKLLNAAYLSVTRGDGGQNLIGPEIRELLGIIRTQELLSARRIDEGRQFFTRANDFGYSKSAEETLEIWEKEKVLSDVVWVIRKFRPDVIITRFPPDGGGGHGHHTSSAILAKEAFDLAGDPNSYPDQLKYVETWQPKRIFLNTGWWWNDSISDEDPGVVTVDVGAYNELLGKSYTEIAALSRSQHKSQGFGATGSRGEQIEFLEIIKGDPAENDPFEDIDLSWSRVEGGKKIQPLVEKLIKEFEPEKPYLSVPGLLELRQKVSSLKNNFWKEIKISQIDELIKACMGLYMEAKVQVPTLTQGDSLKLEFESTNRSPVQAVLKKVYLNQLQKEITLDSILGNNKEIEFEFNTKLIKDIPISQPYWLRKEPTLGMYRVDDQQLIGKPENDPALTTDFILEINGNNVKYTIPLVYKWNDPVKGEQYRPVAITPPVFLNTTENVYMFTGDDPKKVSVVVKSGKPKVSGNIRLELPPGWKAKPEFTEFSMANKGEEVIFEFLVFPPEEQQSAELKVIAEIGNKSYNKSIAAIDYDHIPYQVAFPDAVAKVVKIDLRKKGERIGYIMGAGDEIPQSLEQIGYQVDLLNDEQINKESLKQYDAIILGIRSLNTNERISFQVPVLLEYVKQGGTLITQYNTTRRLRTRDFSPYEIKISRDRVSEENAEITILKPDHPVLNSPNTITQDDFRNWVQERGLYFPDEWSKEFVPILSSHDKGEEPKEGGLLIAKYGKGYYIYSGYSWFRQLPAGVPGAYKLFVNMISLGQGGSTEEAKVGGRK